MIDKQLEQLILLGILPDDREMVLHYLSGKDYNAAKEIIDKNLEIMLSKSSTHAQAIQTLKAFVDSKVVLYTQMFEDVPFDVISDHKPDYEGEEFG